MNDSKLTHFIAYQFSDGLRFRVAFEHVTPARPITKADVASALRLLGKRVQSEYWRRGEDASMKDIYFGMLVSVPAYADVQRALTSDEE